MSQENVELVRERFERFVATGVVEDEWYDGRFVWDMSTFTGWPEKKHYEGAAGVREFLAAWLEAWDDWRVELEELREAGDDRVVSISRQYGRSKSTGVDVTMHFGQVWTLRDGLYVGMQMYATPEEALEAAGLTK
jgi:ketosteroid isomerase-like protein